MTTIPLGPSTFLQGALDALDTLRADVTEHPRISSDQHAVIVAFAVSLRADCTRRRVGCVVYDTHGRIIGTGYNGAPPGRPGCLSAGACPRGQMSKTQVLPGSSYATGASGACIANHAERNGVMFSDPIGRRGGTMAVTDAPCDDCSLMLAGSGLARVLWPEHTDRGLWVIRSRFLDTEPIGGLYPAAV